MPFTESNVAEVRHVVQHILVPCIFVVGVLGNSVSIYVLTRKRMRCTTNIYLTALAITDIIYLLMFFLSSLRHYESVKRNCKFFWQNYGRNLWLLDASAYISIYIAVCFTIERFIAIRYPLKRQTFCTEQLAKTIIAGVAIFCLVTTLGTAFEHDYITLTKLVDHQGRPCNQTPALRETSLKEGAENAMAFGSGGGAAAGLLRIEESVAMERFRRRRRSNEINLSATNIPNIDNSEFLFDAEYLASMTTASTLSSAKGAGVAETANTKATRDVKQKLENFGVDKNDSSSSGGIGMGATVDYCQNVTYYEDTITTLGKNELYKDIMYYFTTFVFVLIPLCVLSTFNFFLVMLVRRSKNLRGEMTNANSLRRPRKNKSNASSVSQENRVTVTLIAVVLLFILCQLPWGIFLIVDRYMEIEDNLARILGNIFNLLAMIDAAANFFLYCVLSDKYRKTIRELITGYRYRHRHGRNNNNTSSLYATSSTSMMQSVVNSSRRYRPTIIK